MDERMPWQTDNPMTILVGGQEFMIIKSGREYADQLRRITAWLSSLGSGIGVHLREMGLSPDRSSGTELAIALFSLGLDPDNLCKLGAALLGSDEQFVAEHFDPGWMVDAIIRIWDNQIGLRFAVQRIQQRFFSNIGGGRN